MSFQVEVTGIRKTVLTLNRVGNVLNDFSPELKTTGQHLKEFYGSIPFQTSGSIYGAPWPKLSNRYAARKAKKYPGRQILVASGTMANSFQFKTSTDHLVLSNSANYFQYHQSRAPRTKIPRRLMMALTDDIIDKVKDILSEGVTDRMRRAL